MSGLPLVIQRLKRLPAMQETQVCSLGWEDPLEKEMAVHSSIPAWRIPWREEPGRLQSTGLQRVRHDWATSLNSVWIKYKVQNGFLYFWIEFSQSEGKNQQWSYQFSSVAQSCLTLCNPMDCNIPGFRVQYQLREFTQTHVHWVSDAI